METLNISRFRENAVCNKDCFNCPYDDCINDELDYEDYRAQTENDKAIKDELRGEKSRKVAAQQRAYYQNNKEKVAAQKRAYYQNNKEKLKRLAVYERVMKEHGIEIPAN